MADIEGWTADGFEGVRDAFAANFTDQAEVGAAFAAYHRGQKVVDLWGGVADPTTERPWEEDSVALVFSTTKGATATVPTCWPRPTASTSKRRWPTTGPSSPRPASKRCR